MPEPFLDGDTSRAQPHFEAIEEAERISLDEQVERLRLLDSERADLGYKLRQLTGKNRFEREESQISAENLGLEEKIDLIRQGKIGQIISRDPEETVQRELVKSLEQRLQRVEEEIEKLVQDPEVAEAYKEFRQQKIEVIKKVRESIMMKSFLDQLDKQEAIVLRGVKKNPTASETQFLGEIQDLRHAIQERNQKLENDSELDKELRIRRLLEYKRQLEGGRFSETPSRLQYMEKVMDYWLKGKPVMLTGPTGTGKTEIFRQLVRKFWGQELSDTLISGSQAVTDYTLFGKPGGMKVRSEGGMDVYFTPAGFTVGMKKGLPVILDEFDLIESNTRLRLKALYNYRPGQEYTVQEDTRYKIPIKEGFCVGMTANIKSEKTKERFSLDAAENRVIEEERIDYLPKEELFDLCLAKLIDRRGRLPLSKDMVNVLIKLVDAAEFIQQTYMGMQTQIFETEGGTRQRYAILEQAVLDPGKVLGTLDGWEQEKSRGKNFQDFIENQLISFVNKEGFPEKDRRLLVQIFMQKYGFFPDRQPREFLVSGLNEQQLESWRTTRNQGVSP